MSPERELDAIAIGTRVSFPYGGSRRTGTVADVSVLPDGAGGTAVSYLIDVGKRKVFVQSDDITPATAPATTFDPVAEGVAYGRKRPRAPRRH
jgi:hypothetical protein